MWGKLYGELIKNGTYEYTYVVSRRPKDKEDIDAYLIKQNRSDLIVETAE